MVLFLFSSHRILQSADCILPAALSALPSVSSFLSPKILPGGFFHGTFGLAV